MRGMSRFLMSLSVASYEVCIRDRTKRHDIMRRIAQTNYYYFSYYSSFLINKVTYITYIPMINRPSIIRAIHEPAIDGRPVYNILNAPRTRIVNNTTVRDESRKEKRMARNTQYIKICFSCKSLRSQSTEYLLDIFYNFLFGLAGRTVLWITAEVLGSYVDDI